MRKPFDARSYTRSYPTEVAADAWVGFVGRVNGKAYKVVLDGGTE